MNKVGLKLRAAIITEVYRKALSVNSTTLSKFSTGQVHMLCVCVMKREREREKRGGESWEEGRQGIE